MTSKSTSGLLVMLAGGPIHWKSQTQKMVTLSSTEAELVILCMAVKEIVWLRKLGLELDIMNSAAVDLMCENQSTIKVALNERSIHRTRHISVRAAYPREKIEEGAIDLKFIRSQQQLADMMTKAQEVKNSICHRDRIMTKTSLLNTMVSLIIILMYMITCSQTRTLERTDPVLWKQTNKIVFGKRVEFKLSLMWINPCKEFDSHSNSFPHRDAKKRCQKVNG